MIYIMLLYFYNTIYCCTFVYMEKTALNWWNSLSEDNRKNKMFNYCEINEMPISHFEIVHILDIYELNHPKRLIMDMGLISAKKWFAEKTHLEQHKLSDIYFDSKNPTMLSNDEICEIWKKEIVNKQNTSKILNISSVESQLFENQKVIMETLHNLVCSTQYINDKENLEKNLRNNIIATETILLMNK